MSPERCFRSEEQNGTPAGRIVWWRSYLLAAVVQDRTELRLRCRKAEEDAAGLTAKLLTRHFVATPVLSAMRVARQWRALCACAENVLCLRDNLM